MVLIAVILGIKWHISLFLTYNVTKLFDLFKIYADVIYYTRIFYKMALFHVFLTSNTYS